MTGWTRRSIVDGGKGPDRTIYILLTLAAVKGLFDNYSNEITMRPFEKSGISPKRVTEVR